MAILAPSSHTQFDCGTFVGPRVPVLGFENYIDECVHWFVKRYKIKRNYLNFCHMKSKLVTRSARIAMPGVMQKVQPAV